MTSLRRSFRRIAALVLLVWLFAAGTAFAQACEAMAHVLCEECCAEMQATPAPAELRQDAATPAQPAAGWITAALPVAHPMQAGRHAGAGPLPAPPGERPRIPIVFLRLAL